MPYAASVQIADSYSGALVTWFVYRQCCIDYFSQSNALQLQLLGSLGVIN